MMTRRAFVFSLSALALSAMPPQLAWADDALAFVQSLYALPNLWGDVTADGPAIAKYLDANLGALITANYAKDNPDAALDYDPLVQAQDFQDVKTTFSVGQESDSSATITVGIQNFEDHTTVTLNLTRTAGGWRLANIHGQDGPGLVEELKQLNATKGGD